ncbi:MAG: hypothetical protein ABIQ27_11290 [Flavobacterium sp.]|uniref:tetratricopeptide repeat protein n=1 Tax=Flavobacterium sp. TaxID=239 RepID=UPI003266C455
MQILKSTIIVLSSLLFIQCKNVDTPIVSKTYIDSLLTNYGTPKAITINQENLEFWKNRIQKNGFDIVNEPKYASTLVGRFNLLGDFNDVKTADSILINVEKNFNNKEAGIFLFLASNSILQHHFKKANEYLQKAKSLGIRKSEEYTITFDVDFELGNIKNATENLEKLKLEGGFGYQFRKSKLAHYNGDFEQSIASMKRATEMVVNDAASRNISLSNGADLYTHVGELDNAYSDYKESIKLNSADLHSIMGIGWIALQHDNNDALAEKIFKFVQTKTKSPEPLYKLILVAQHKKDLVAEKKYAKQYESIVTDSIYGSMYTKYLIQLYTQILNNPAKAEILSKAELTNRATPQTYSWYAYSLFANNKIEEANAIYKKYISGKPLEALELYYMGKLMEANKKGYNAEEFYKAANENYYDLSPSIARDLKSKLNE